MTIKYEIDKNWLYEQYIVLGRHAYDIKDDIGCGKMVIYKRLKQYNIPIRNKSESKMGKRNPMFGVSPTKETIIKRSIALSGSKHPLWKGKERKVRYPLPQIEYEALLETIRKRDGNACIVCGATVANIRGDKLCVHHIDGERYNNDPENMRTLCQKHHLQLEWKLHKE